MSVSAGPRVSQNGLLMDLDIANIKQYSGSGSTVTDVISGNAFTGNNATYYTFSNGTIQFTRTDAVPKDGGGLYVIPVVGSSLAANTFCYNNFTWEVWARIDDRNYGNYADATEVSSTLAVYSGYHQGFYYSNSSIIFTIWDTGPTGRTVGSYTLGASGTQVIEDRWHQIVMVRDGTTYKKYVDGAPVGTDTTITITAPSPFVVSNTLRFGKTQNLAAGAGSYAYYSKNTLAINRMYNVALTAPEIQQNFASTRGRFGI